MLKELPNDYLSRFPSTMRECLEDEEQMSIFMNTVDTSYPETRVFRFIHEGDKITEYDFLDNVRDYEYRGKVYRYRHLIASHAISVNEDKGKMMRCFTTFPNKDWKGIAVGVMNDEFGPADNINGHSHHNWYLYDGCNKVIANKYAILKEEYDE